MTTFREPVEADWVQIGQLGTRPLNTFLAHRAKARGSPIEERFQVRDGISSWTTRAKLSVTAPSS